MARTEGRSSEGGGEAPTAQGPVCPVTLCPVGMFLTVTGDLRPEVVEHLLKAGRELMLATRALLESRLHGPDAKGPRLEKIEIE